MTNFQKSFFWLKDEEGGYCGWKFQVNNHFAFAIATWPLFQHQENEKFQFFLYPVPAEMPYLQKVFRNFQKGFFAERWGRWLLSFKISGAQISWFCNTNVTTFQYPENEIFQFFLYTVLTEMLYLQKYLMNFQKHFLAERWGRWLLSLKILGAQIFWFCNSNVTNFQHPENVKISIFPLHCPCRNAITSKVFNEFSKKFFVWKMGKVAIVVENVKRTVILLL